MPQVAKRHAAPRCGVVTASRIIGESVVGRRYEEPGKIHELGHDSDEGRVTDAFLASSGFSGMGTRPLARPWHAFEVAGIGHEPIFDINEEEPKAAPAVDRGSKWAKFAGRDVGNRYPVARRHSPCRSRSGFPVPALAELDPADSTSATSGACRAGS